MDTSKLSDKEILNLLTRDDTDVIEPASSKRDELRDVLAQLSVDVQEMSSIGQRIDFRDIDGAKLVLSGMCQNLTNVSEILATITNKVATPDK